MRSLLDQIQLYDKLWQKNSRMLGSSVLEPDPIPIYTIGIYLPEELHATMGELSNNLRQLQPDAPHKWLLSKQMHITLELPGRLGKHFEATDIPRMTERLQEICKNRKPFTIELGNINCFPVALFCEVYDEAGNIFALHNAIADSIPWSEHPEYRYENFIPHMSLCYLQEDAVPLVRSMEFSRLLPPLPMPVESIYFSKWHDVQGRIEIEDIAIIQLDSGRITKNFL